MEVSMGNIAKAEPAVFASDKKFDASRADYLGQVNETMAREAGVRYLEVKDSIHPGGEAWKDAYDRMVQPSAFVDRTISDFGFRRLADGHSPEDARNYNLAKAAMCEFSSGNADWTRGNAGIIFKKRDEGVAVLVNEVPDGVGVMFPVRERKSGRFGFGIEFRAGAQMDEYKTRLEVPGEKSGQYAAMDMSDAIEDYDKARRVERDFRF